MPVMDGVATLRAIRERERERGLRAVPALAITAHPLSGRGRHLAAEGFAGALAKPIDGDALADAAARCLPDLPDARA
jgi:CheY-like chemotaxis protein